MPGLRNPIALLVGALIGFMLPRFWLGRRKSGRLNAFNKQLPDTITLIANALRAGSSFLQAIELVKLSGGDISLASGADEFGRLIFQRIGQYYALYPPQQRSALLATIDQNLGRIDPEVLKNAVGYRTALMAARQQLTAAASPESHQHLLLVQQQVRQVQPPPQPPQEEPQSTMAYYYWLQRRNGGPDEQADQQLQSPCNVCLVNR